MEKVFGLETIELRKKLLIDSEEFEIKIYLTKEKTVYTASLYKNDIYLDSYNVMMNKLNYSDLLDFCYKFIAMYFKSEREKDNSLKVFSEWDGVISKNTLIEYEV